MKKGEYTIREAEYIQHNYLTQTDAQLAEFLNRSEESVKKFRRRYLQLPKPAPVASKPKPQKSPKTSDSIIYYRSNRPYRYVKSPNGEWVKEIKLLWEQANGPIPAGHFLRCKSQDTLDTRLDNWQLVNRGKQMLLNRNPPVQAQSLKKTWNKVKTLEANGLKPRCKLKSTYKKKEPKEKIFTLHRINTHTDMHF